MTDKIRKATDTFLEIFVIYIIVLLLSGTAFSFLEDKGLFDSIWWASATATTVGYGDIYPVTVLGKLIGMFLMNFVPLVVAPLIIVRLTSNIIEDNNAFTNDEQEELKRELKEIKELLKDKL